MSLSKEDYTEPCCPLNMHPEIKRIPLGRVFEKLDAYLAHEEYAAAERHLLYWLSEAETGNDLQGKLTLFNELIGLYRKCGKEAEGLEAVDSALKTLKTLGIEETVTGGTTYLNAATGLKAFGQAEEALPLYRKAIEVYEKELPKDDGRLAGLYNNMALALVDLSLFDEAEEKYEKALTVLTTHPENAGEAAITWLNLADLYHAKFGLEDGDEKINACLEKAETLLHAPEIPENAAFAYILEKCAPVFGYYGWFLAEQEFSEMEKTIRENME